MFTVKQLSDLAGVTPRTLHHYDQIGLLKPTMTGANGYRYYGDESLLQLQQILFYRELGLPLDDIKNIMGRRDFDVLKSLESHKIEIQKHIAKLERMNETVDNTIAYLKGQINMSKKQLFEVFSDERQAEYEKEVMQKYDPETVKASIKKWKSYTAADKQRIGEEGNAAYEAIVAAIPKGASSSDAQAGVELWRNHMDYFWTPDNDQLMGLAEMYNDDLRFKANFDKIDPRLAEFMLEAVKVYVTNNRK